MFWHAFKRGDWSITGFNLSIDTADFPEGNAMTKYLGNRSSTLYGPLYAASKDLRILSVSNQTCEQEFKSLCTWIGGLYTNLP